MVEQNKTQRSDLFTLYQVRLRAEEIEVVSNETYNSDLQKLIDKSYEKMNHDYELQKNAITRDAKISYSVSKNENRINVLKSQQDTIDRATELTRKKLAEFCKSDDYNNILCDLIKQGLDELNEKKSKLRVVKADVKRAQDCLGRLSGMGYETFVDEETYLDDSLIGGVMVINETETISVDNTFEGRLQLAKDTNLPKIARILHTK